MTSVCRVVVVGLFLAAGAVSEGALGFELPFRVGTKEMQLGVAGEGPHLSRAFQIEETDLVCDMHEVTLLVRVQAPNAMWVVAQRTQAPPEQAFRLVAQSGEQALIVTRCPTQPWYSAHGPFRWRASNATLPLLSDAAHTIRVRTDAPPSVPVQLYRSDGEPAAASCARYDDGLRECIGVSTAAPLLVIFDANGGLHWAVVSPPRHVLQTMDTVASDWGSLVHLYGIGEAEMAASTLAVIREKDMRHRVRSMRPLLVADWQARVHRLDRSAWWIAGVGGVGDRLVEVRGPSVAAHRVDLGPVVAGPPLLPFALLLRPGSTVTGQITGSDERPVANALVSMFEYAPDTGQAPNDGGARTHRWVVDAVSDRNGRFVLHGVATKVYEFVAVHPTQGRATVDWAIGGRPLAIRFATRSRVRGRVLRSGFPASGLPVRLVPSREAFALAQDPLRVVAPMQVTDGDGQFDLAVPDDGDGHVVIGGRDSAVVRVAYPDASSLRGTLDLGEIELPGPITLFVRFRLGCDIRSVGPVGQLGVTAVRAGFDAAARLYQLQLPEPGLWWVEAICFESPVPGATRLVSVRDDGEPRVIELPPGDEQGG